MRPPTILEHVRYDVAEHEVLLSFNADDDARKFMEWWSNSGEQSFLDVAKYYD